jgi:hypothetical protein
MKRNTAMAIAGGVTATVASTTLAVGLNLGIMKSDAQSGPGTFDPVATTTSTSTVAVPTTVADPVVVTMYVDENGNPCSGPRLVTTAPVVPATAAARSGNGGLAHLRFVELGFIEPGAVHPVRRRRLRRRWVLPGTIPTTTIPDEHDSDEHDSDQHDSDGDLDDD